MNYLTRYLEQSVLHDLNRKMVFIGGPRQAGKTTTAKILCSKAAPLPNERYLNWDDPVDREHLLLEQFPTGPGFLVLDEIHKYRNWRNMVKGLFDKRGHELNILVTGSARLDYYRRGGDSLQGRYHYYTLYPLTLAELKSPHQSTLVDLLHFGGFPEPFLMASEKESRRWSLQYRTRLIREDLRDLERVLDIDSIEKMVLHLPNLVGSPLSLNNLREDLHVSHQSVSRWITMLENLYMLFRIYPFGAPQLRAVKKEAKHYHLDWTLVRDPGARFENLVACHLLKWCSFARDSEGRNIELRYFRDVDRREVDFVLVEDGKPFHFVECKVSAKKPVRPLLYLKKRFPGVAATQVSFKESADMTTKENIRMCPAYRFLGDFI